MPGMEISLDGKVALVTGASKGIGRAIAEAYAAAGASVVLSSRKQDLLDQLATEIAKDGGEATAFAANAGEPEQIAACVAATIERYGRVDILVNNAATNAPYGPLMDADPDRWRHAFAVNVEAALRLVQLAWRAWMREHGGAVVNICTEGTHGVGPNVGAYGTSKAALRHLTHQLAGELAPAVRVNAVSPGLVRTEMARFVWEGAQERIAEGLPLGRFGEPEDVARAVLWLVSDEAEWVTGTDLLVDGGTRVRAAAGTGSYAVHEQLRAAGSRATSSPERSP